MTLPKSPRRAKLEEFVACNPNDAFARYGLAMECVLGGDDADAENHFRQLLSAHPAYVAGYYHFGQLLARLERSAEARQVWMSGIDVARKAGDTHAQSELQAALDSMSAGNGPQ